MSTGAGQGGRGMVGRCNGSYIFKRTNLPLCDAVYFYLAGVGEDGRWRMAFRRVVPTKEQVVPLESSGGTKMVLHKIDLWNTKTAKGRENRER